MEDMKTLSDEVLRARTQGEKPLKLDSVSLKSLNVQYGYLGYNVRPRMKAKA